MTDAKVEELAKIINNEHQLDGYCATGLMIAKRLIKEGYCKQSPQPQKHTDGMVTLDEKALKRWYQDNTWYFKFGTSLSDLTLMNDFIKSICSKFATPAVPRELIDKVETLKASINSADLSKQDQVIKDLRRQIKAIHNLLTGGKKND